MTPTTLQREQPEPIKMMIEYPPLASLDLHEATMKCADLASEAFERITDRMGEVIRAYYGVEEPND